MIKKIILSIIIGILALIPILCSACECENFEFSKIGYMNIMRENTVYNLFETKIEHTYSVNRNDFTELLGLKKCGICNGRGVITCRGCSGKGYVYDKWSESHKKICSECRGAGRTKCFSCFGSGYHR